MSKKNLIICDLSDVLVKGLEGTEHSLSQQLNMPTEDVARQLFTYNYTPLWYGDVSERDFFTTMLDNFGWDMQIDTLLGIIHENFYEIEGTRAIFQKLCKRHTLVLYSVNCPEWVERVKKIIDYSNIFEHEFYSYELKAHKKEPNGFRKIKQLYKDHGYYLIDDSSSNIRMAESLGIAGIHFISPKQLADGLKERNL